MGPADGPDAVSASKAEPTSALRILRPTVLVPVLAVLVLVVAWGDKPAPVVLVVAGLFLAGSVLVAVHHAEVVAHRVGEPFGALILAIAVTVIEVALIITLMVSSDSGTSTLARDTVFAAVMITCNGIVGVSLLVGALRQRVAHFNAEGTATALATVLTLATLTLVASDLHDQHAGARVLLEPTRVRRRGVARAVRAVRVRTDRPAP